MMSKSTHLSCKGLNSPYIYMIKKLVMVIKNSIFSLILQGI